MCPRVGAHVSLAQLCIGSSATPQALHPLTPLAFPGEADVLLTMRPPLPGPGRDLNLMWDRETHVGAVHMLRADTAGSSPCVEAIGPSPSSPSTCTGKGERATGESTVDVEEADEVVLQAPLVFVVAVAGPAVLHVQGERVELGEEDALRVERVACGDSAPLPSLHVRVEVGRAFVGALGHRPVPSP